MEKAVCSYCGNNTFTEFTGGVASGVMPLSGKTNLKEPLNYSVCLKCGTVNRIYVKNPYKLVVKSGNRFV